MLNIFAPINLLGYGIHANNLIKALTDIGQELTLTKLGAVQNDPYFEAYWKAADQNIIKFDSRNPSLFIFHDEYSYQASGSPLMTFSIFETSILKPLSKQILINGPADIVLATTDAHKNLLLENGITKPIHVVNEGVDDCIFNTIPCDKAIDTKKFTFITAGKRELRKSTDEIIYAFISTMKDKEVALIAHTFNPFLNKTKDHPFKNLTCWTGIDPQAHGFQYIGWMGKWHKFSSGKADIYFTAPIFQTPELPTLYHSANVGIQCSKGEGWNLPCHLPGTKIITADGIKDIDKVKETDLLLTHTGSFKNIIRCMKNKNTKQVYDWNCFGNYISTKSTEEHPIYAIKKENITEYKKIYDIEPEWIKVKELKKGDVVIKAIAREYETNTTIDLATLDKNLLYDDTKVWYATSYNTSNDNSYSSLCLKYKTTRKPIEKAYKHIKNNSITKNGTETKRIYDCLANEGLQSKEPTKFNRYIDISNISELIGLYIAKGSSDESKIVITLHEKEINKCLELVKNQVGFLSDNVSIWTKKHRGTKACDICISGKITSLLFQELCGKGAHNKRIPPSILFGKKEHLKKLLDWYVFGNGYCFSNMVTCSTVSEQLGNELVVGFERLGFIPHIRKDKRGSYYIYYTTDHTNDKKGIRNWKHKYGIAKLIRSVRKADSYNGDVFNFSVADDNSYTLCAGTTHNCTEMMACGIPCVATMCLGHGEYLCNTVDRIVPKIQSELIIFPTGKEVANDGIWFKGEQGEWSTVKTQDIADRIRYVEENKSKYETKSEELSSYITTNFSWRKAAEKIITLY